MYRIITNDNTFNVDAIEYIKVIGGEYVPVVEDEADGFKAMKIIHVSSTVETYRVSIYAFPDHTLIGGEETATIELVEDEDETDEFTSDDFVEMIEEIL